MTEQINALLVHAQDEISHGLARALGSLDVRVIHVQSCREASRLLKNRDAIDLVFAAIALPDGSWADVLRLARRSKGHLPVIIVSRKADLRLYLDAVEKGVFDLVSPPFLTSDMAHIVRSAIYRELVGVQRDLSAPPAV